MYWLSSPPWGRWLLAALVAGLAFWIELRPDPTQDWPFAATTIERGDQVDPSMLDTRRVPIGLLGDTPVGDVALRRIPEGSPVLDADLGGREEVVPGGWWLVGLDIPPGAVAGDKVRVVLLDSGVVVDGVVVFPSTSDPLSSSNGSAAFPDEHAAAVAAAAAQTRITVLLGA